MDPLSVPARLEALGTVGAYVLDAAAAAGLEQRAAYRLRLAVDEVATNIIVHGRPDDHSILLKAIIDSETVSIVLEDAGPPFNPLESHPAPNVEQPLHERQIGGLGVFLAVKSVDRFHYDRVGGINRNTLVVRRGSHEATAR